MTPQLRISDLDRLSRGRIHTEEDALALIATCAGVRTETHEAVRDVAAVRYLEEFNETR